MNQFIKILYSVFAILFLVPATGLSQKPESKDSLNNVLINTARKIISSAGTCALITLDKEGRPRVREMDPFLPKDDFTIWFGTNPNSRKVAQIKNNPRATLYYLDDDDSGYVMIYGIAQLVNDQNEKDKHWKEEWQAFYPNKTNNYILIKIIPEWMEVISYAYGIVGDSITWEPPKVIFNSN